MRGWWLFILVFFLVYVQYESPNVQTGVDQRIGTDFHLSALPSQFEKARVLSEWRTVNGQVRQRSVSEQCILRVYSVALEQVASFGHDPSLTNPRVTSWWRTRGYMRANFPSGSHYSGYSGLEGVLATSVFFPLESGLLCKHPPPAEYLHPTERGRNLWADDRTLVLVQGGQIGGGACCDPRAAVWTKFGIIDPEEGRLYLLFRVIPVSE